MSVIDDLIASQTAQQFKARVLSVCSSVALKVSSWIEGEPSEQWLQVVSRMFYDVHVIIRDSNRAHFLDTATDPGDEDGDENPRAGWLSAKGKSDYGPERTDKTFATGFVTLTNGGQSTHVLRPEKLTFQNSATEKTYRNTVANLYGAAGYTLAPSGVVTVPIRAEEIGTASNSAATEIDTLVSSLDGVTVSNASPVLGTDRENYLDYRARCRLAAAATSPNGPAAAYEYIALNTNADGSLGTPDDGKTKVNVTRVQVTKNNAFGAVNVWLASPSGAATTDDVIAVRANIERYAVPDCITLTVSAAVAVNVTVTGTITGNAAPGLTTGIVSDAATAAETAFFSTAPVGGFDGWIYDEKIAAVAIQSHSSLYKYVGSSPSGDTSLAEGEVAVLVGPTFSVVLQ